MPRELHGAAVLCVPEHSFGRQLPHPFIRRATWTSATLFSGICLLTSNELSEQKIRSEPWGLI